jgi:DNA-binding response OmpR family regulator
MRNIPGDDVAALGFAGMPFGGNERGQRHMTSIANRRILIVEDNALIADHIADVVASEGASPLGPVLTEREAIDMLAYDDARPDAAILDLHIDGTSMGVAERLRALDVPFIFATGNRGDIPAHFATHPVCEKPFSPAELLTALRKVFGA